MTADQPDTHPSADSPEYDELLRKYGEAMLRISRLEGQVGRLKEESVENASSEGGAARAEEIRPAPADTGPKSGERSREEEISHLRLRVVALSNQLAVAQQKNDERTEERAPRRRRRRHDPRPIWMFWKREKRYSKA